MDQVHMTQEIDGETRHMSVAAVAVDEWLHSGWAVAPEPEPDAAAPAAKPAARTLES